MFVPRTIYVQFTVKDPPGKSQRSASASTEIGNHSTRRQWSLRASLPYEFPVGCTWWSVEPAKRVPGTVPGEDPRIIDERERPTACLLGQRSRNAPPDKVYIVCQPVTYRCTRFVFHVEGTVRRRITRSHLRFASLERRYGPLKIAAEPISIRRLNGVNRGGSGNWIAGSRDVQFPRVRDNLAIIIPSLPSLFRLFIEMSKYCRRTISKSVLARCNATEMKIYIV